ncbi:MAG: hypothetical protein M1326_00110 [Cyanobacteria bacterium]|nr:hypothetical protein [Cyanobacteriota bacterium]
MRHVIDYIRKNKILFLVILPAFFFYMVMIIPSGSYYCFNNTCGINFWGVQGHDGIWHMAIANVSFNRLPFISPIFSGKNLYGYNYLLDFFIFLLTKVGIQAIFSYFKLFPIVWFILFTFLLIALARKLEDSPLFIGIFIFLNYFAGSFYFLIKLYHYGSINDSSTQLPQPVIITMSNPPYAFSLILLLLILVLLKSKKIKYKNILISGICLFLMMGMKFYGGVISFFLVLVFLLLSHNSVSKIADKIKYLLIIILLTLLGLFIFYNPMQSFKTGSVFIFAPFSLMHAITESPDMFYLKNLTDMRYYLASHGFGPRLLAVELINLFIFLFFYLGTRFFAFFYIIILLLKKKLDSYDYSIVLTIIFSIILTATFIQKGEWWNTIQFFYFAIFLTTIYLSRFVYDLIKNKKYTFKIIAFIIIILSIPTSIDLIKFFKFIPGETYLPKEEIEALNFLKNQPDGVVYAPLYDQKWKSFTKQNPLYAYDDTAYIAAFSGKQEYLADDQMLRNTGFCLVKRLDKVRRLDCSILGEVNYIYEIRDFPDSDKIAIKCKSPKIKTIFTNGKIIIYSVKKG